MDSINSYPTLIREALNDYFMLATRDPVPHYEMNRIYDDEHHNYIVQKLGWTESKRINQTMLQVTLRDSKIWIEEDWTEEGVATYFLEHGVPHDHIVLGFQPPIMRPYTEFAVA